tara:strand:- start:613 stop:801 length:189 start_codon:yes stop_codon:yes gene_type:complete
MPVIRTQNRIKELNSGDQLTVHCTDPGALEDIPAWCRINGHEIISSIQEDKEIHITIEVGIE